LEIQEQVTLSNSAAYDSPLYEGLWPMTIEAFQASDAPNDKEVFAFNLALN
jgi:hypothetical protein